MMGERGKLKYVERPFNEKRSPAEVPLYRLRSPISKNLEMLWGIN